MHNKYNMIYNTLQKTWKPYESGACEYESDVLKQVRFND
jgi:hypothetical protein